MVNKKHIDQIGREVLLQNFPPKRIVSLVPSISELLFDLEVYEGIVGRTKFCVHPRSIMNSIPIVGGTKNIQINKIRELNPDLIICNKEENTPEIVAELEKEFPVWVTDVVTFDDAMKMIMDLSQLLNNPQRGEQLVKSLEMSINAKLLKTRRKKVAYLIWNNPMMVAANQTFINSLLDRLGFVNVFADQERYPEVTEADLKSAKPEIIFLSSEPFPFAEEHRKYIKTVCPLSKVELVDGATFSWYGSRLLNVVSFMELFNDRLRNF